MNKAQFLILNLAGVACAALVLAATFLNRQNDGAMHELETIQARLNRVQQVQLTARNLAARIARAAESDPALRALAAKHEIGPASTPTP